MRLRPGGNRAHLDRLGEGADDPDRDQRAAHGRHPEGGRGNEVRGPALWLEDVKAAGGIAVGKKKYPVELVIEDNESKAESAVKVTTKMITEDDILIMIGPQASKQAVPRGGDRQQTTRRR